MAHVPRVYKNLNKEHLAQAICRNPVPSLHWYLDPYGLLSTKSFQKPLSKACIPWVATWTLLDVKKQIGNRHVRQLQLSAGLRARLTEMA